MSTPVCDMEGESQNTRVARDSHYLQDATGNVAGNSYSGPTSTENLMQQYESLFGPAGRDIKLDSQRNKRHQRWHLPDSLRGYNSFLTDRIDGLITDATKSPFTRNILPYVYLENPDAKFKWNVYSFDEGLASRVPYESAARVLTQSKSSQAGYAIRQGLAIAMEHNFLASAAGRENFKNQLTQLVGSIQMTNDLDVHMALLQAMSYERKTKEKYYGVDYSLKRIGKMYCDLFGIYNKIPNALDLLIEEARTKLKTWGSEPPTFMLCPSNLTVQLTMSPERTDYITNGPDGLKRLAQGPDLPSYRGLSIIYSKKFNLEPGREPRNVLKRKVRVAEYYWLPYDARQQPHTLYEFYDQETDSFKSFSKQHFLKASRIEDMMNLDDHQPYRLDATNQTCHWYTWDWDQCDVLLMRPNIEHEMLSLMIGRGGTQELGATFWGQTELACFDDAQHGIWGMSYKYHERAIVTNERNLIRIFDVAFDGYNGGMACDVLSWEQDEIEKFRDIVQNTENPFKGKSMLVFAFPRLRIKDDKRVASHETDRYLRYLSNRAGPKQANAQAKNTLRGNEVANSFSMIDSITQYIQPKNSSFFKQSNLLINAVIYDQSETLGTFTHFLRYMNIINNNPERLQINGFNSLPAGDPNLTFPSGLEDVQKWNWVLGGAAARFQINVGEFLTLSAAPANELSFSEIYDYNSDTGTPIRGLADGTAAGQFVGRLAAGNQLTSIKFLRSMMYSMWKTTNSNVCRHIFEDRTLWTEIEDIDKWTMSQFIRYFLSKIITQYCADHGLDVTPLLSTAQIDLSKKVTEYTHIDVSKFEDSIIALTVPSEEFTVNIVSNRAMRFSKNDDYFQNLNIFYLMSTVKTQMSRPNPNTIIKKWFNSTVKETTPVYDLPNPLILNNTFSKQITTSIQLDPEGIHKIGDAEEFIFWDQYQHSGNRFAEELLNFYNNQTSSMFAQNISVSAYEHIRSNTCDIPCLAYHGNMRYTRYDGGYNDIKCTGHLGNSFPGVASVRDGRGVVPVNSLSKVFGNH